MSRGINEVLHFAPEPQLLGPLRAAFSDARYRTTDRFRADVDLPGLDIQALDLPDGEVDLIICNHVLEHVPDDQAAIAELARVLRPKGAAVITIPGNWQQDRTDHFAGTDRNGHFRHYGNDVARQFEKAFGSVERITGAMIDPSWRQRGIRPQEPVFVCREPLRTPVTGGD